MGRATVTESSRRRVALLISLGVTLLANPLYLPCLLPAMTGTVQWIGPLTELPWLTYVGVVYLVYGVLVGVVLVRGDRLTFDRAMIMTAVALAVLLAVLYSLAGTDELAVPPIATGTGLTTLGRSLSWLLLVIPTALLFPLGTARTGHERRLAASPLGVVVLLLVLVPLQGVGSPHWVFFAVAYVVALALGTGVFGGPLYVIGQSLVGSETDSRGLSVTTRQ